MSDPSTTFNESVINIDEDSDDGNESRIHELRRIQTNPSRFPTNTNDFSNHQSTSDLEGSVASGIFPSPSPDGELFSPNYVDQMVDSFWTKVDQKIEDAVLLKQTAQKNHRQAVQEEIQEKEKERKLAVEKYTKYFDFSYSFIFIVEHFLRIWTLCKRNVSNKAKSFQNFLLSITWRENLAFYLFHRTANCVIASLTVIDVTLVLILILMDFDIINEKSNKMAFEILQGICIVIMLCFVLEIFLKIVSIGSNILKDSLEVFDSFLVTFYFCAEMLASNGLRNSDGTYPRYIHIMAILRLWRVILVANEMCSPEKNNGDLDQGASRGQS